MEQTNTQTSSVKTSDVKCVPISSLNSKSSISTVLLFPDNPSSICDTEL